MASYQELLALGRDPVRVRAVARRLLASAEDWTEWERDFLEGLVAEYGSAALTTHQRQKLAELRDGAEYVSTIEGFDVSIFASLLWPGLLLCSNSFLDVAQLAFSVGKSRIERLWSRSACETVL